MMQIPQLWVAGDTLCLSQWNNCVYSRTPAEFDHYTKDTQSNSALVNYTIDADQKSAFEMILTHLFACK